MDKEELMTKQYIISPAAGKRLIAKSLLFLPSMKDALESRTVVIIAGSTNSYVAEEFLESIKQLEGFSQSRFYRGITLPPKYKKPEPKGEDRTFIGDVVISNGVWEKGKTIFDVADQLKTGDIIIKGANAVNLDTLQAAVLIGHPTAGTVNPILQCMAGRRVGLYIPIGLEKRISGNINEIALKLNSVNAEGLRYMPLSGRVITELQAINQISGAKAELIAGGGVCGAEGSYLIAVTGVENQLKIMDELYPTLQEEPNFILSYN